MRTTVIFMITRIATILVHQVSSIFIRRNIFRKVIVREACTILHAIIQNPYYNHWFDDKRVCCVYLLISI